MCPKNRCSVRFYGRERKSSRGKEAVFRGIVTTLTSQIFLLLPSPSGLFLVSEANQRLSRVGIRSNDIGYVSSFNL